MLKKAIEKENEDMKRHKCPRIWLLIYWLDFVFPVRSQQLIYSETSMAADGNKGLICVTGGTGFLGSWTIKRLLEDGYSVNATVRMHPDRQRDLSYLTDLPGAADRLRLFNADLDNPASFAPAIAGCDGVFHMAHPLDLEEKETEEVKLRRIMAGLRGILQACADSPTVRRVVYTSSVSAACISGSPDPTDETCWTDVDFIRSLKTVGGPYMATKIVAEKAAHDIAGSLGLDLVSVLPTWISGPFICPNKPDTVHISLALILGLGINSIYKFLKESSIVHVDDVARAHIHLFEYPEAKGRYICSAVEFTIEQLYDFISKRYSEFKLVSLDSWKVEVTFKMSGFSTNKLLETGFKYENRLAEIFDGAIKCFKKKGFL